MNDLNIQVVKFRKLTRDTEGSILKRIEPRKTRNGKTKLETVYYARCRYTDNEGKSREKKRRANSYNDAVILRRQLRDEIQKDLTKQLENKPQKPILFSEVIDYFEAEYVKPAEYSGNEKISGYREPLQNIRRHLNILRQEFGEKNISDIKYSDLKKFKEKRLAVPVVVRYKVKTLLTDRERLVAIAEGKHNKQFKVEWHKSVKPRKVATVNRELQRLRRIFRIAIQNGWLTESPFANGDSLISQASETERIRILSTDEERRLFSVSGELLKAVLVCALDTCLRKNEIFTLEWKDINFEQFTISVKALNTKTLKSRSVPITDRLYKELLNLKNNRLDEFEPRVFGVNDCNSSFYTALEKAGINDFRFHDLRATGITRFLRAGMPPAEVMKISGHTVWKTFMRYVRIDEDTISRSKAALDSYLESMNR